MKLVRKEVDDLSEKINKIKDIKSRDYLNKRLNDLKKIALNEDMLKIRGLKFVFDEIDFIRKHIK